MYNTLLLIVLVLAGQDADQKTGSATSGAAGETRAASTQKAIPFREEKVGDVAVAGVTAKGVSAGIPITVDEAFAEKHQINAISAMFRVIVPQDKGVLMLPGGQKTGVPELLRLSVGTDDGRAVEILRFTNLTLPQTDSVQQRLALCEEVLRDKGLQAVTDGYEQIKYLESYATKVGRYDAVCVHAHMKKPETGDHYAVKLVGILNPQQNGCVLAFLMADTALSDIKTPGDLAAKGIGLQIIHSLQFADAPAAASSGAATMVASDRSGEPGVKADSPEALKLLAVRLQKGHSQRDAEVVQDVTLGLLPTSEQILAALAPDAPEADRDAVLKLHAGLPKEGQSLLGLLSMRPEQTEIQVHAATTEQLAGTVPASAGLQEFPGGSVQAAKKGLLRKGMTFYEVEFLEPGKDAGMKFHLFYWTGASWKMLGPVWRTVSN